MGAGVVAVDSGHSIRATQGLVELQRRSDMPVDARLAEQERCADSQRRHHRSVEVANEL